MKKMQVKIFWIVGGALLFNWVFWNEKMAINTVLYGVFLLGVLFSLYPDARQSGTVRWLLAGHLLCLAMVLVQNTGLSKIAYASGVFMFVVFIIAGLFLTTPVILGIRLSLQLPFDIGASRLSFCFLLVLIGGGYYFLFFQGVSRVLFHEGISVQLAAISIAIILSVRSLRLSYFKLKDEYLKIQPF